MKDDAINFPRSRADRNDSAQIRLQIHGQVQHSTIPALPRPRKTDLRAPGRGPRREILQHHGPSDGGGGGEIILEYACNDSVRNYIKLHEPQSLSRRLSWAEQLAASVHFIHSRGVLHGDISCNNAFLDEALDLKLGDFAGSSIDVEPPLVCYETSHEHPQCQDISLQSEVFALGCALYEIMTSSKPYEG